MLNHDDKEFKAYLREFHPRSPEALRIETDEYPSPRAFVRTGWFLAASAVSLVALLTLDFRARTYSAQTTALAPGVEQRVNTKPMTIRSANALLAASSSFKAAVDEMAFQPQSAPLSKNKHSALVVLSKENTKL